MRNIFITSFIAFSSFCASVLHAQTLPADRAEQDACNALEICGNSFTTQYSYQGIGLVTDLPNTPCNSQNGSPAGAGEENSVWLKMHIISSGTIVFTLTPLTYSDDYDWAIVNITQTSCSNFSSSDVVRCNFNNNQNPVNGSGITGLDNTATITGAPAGTTGSNFLRRIDAVAGQTYLIMINNFGSGNGGGTLGSGFTIDFTGSTAVFNDQSKPKFQSISNICFSGNTVTLDISKDIKCSSIATNASDFILSPNIPIASVTGTNCNSMNQGYTNQISLTFNQQLTPGTYYLKARTGTDNNTLLDLCENALALPDSIKFVVSPDNRTTQTVNLEGCNQVVFNGKTYTESATVTDTALNSVGCDSIYYTANITVYKNPTLINEDVGSCDSVTFRGITYYDNATVIDTFKNHLGCDSVLHFYHIIPEHLELTVTADPPEPVIGDLVKITTSANTDIYNVQSWSPQALFPNQFAKSQSYIIPHSDTIIIVATSPQGCVDTAKFFLKADTLVPVVVMPNAFSPNGDGLNDEFEPKFVNKSGYLVRDFKVFDRWGKLVYQAASTKKASWNGLYSNDGKPAATGTYFFYINVDFIDGTKGYLKGDVTIVR